MKKIIKNIIFSNNLLFKLYCRYFWYPRNGSIEYFFMKYAKYKPFFIQVGANDGKVADPFYRFVKGFQWEGIFVEPQKYVFKEKLLSNYKKDKNIIFENSAIYKETKSKFLYKISFSDSRWATGLSTFYEEQLKKSISSGYVERKANEFNEKLPQKLDEYITAEKVNCITFDDNGESNCVDDSCTSDFDQDGVKDDIDAFPDDPTQTNDSDGDGFGDNMGGNNPDACPNTPPQWVANITSYGCSWEESDDDSDNLLNGHDNCPSTPDDEINEIDDVGCGISERDTDGDGTVDADDQCPETKEGAEMVESGCSKNQLSYSSGQGDSEVNYLVVALFALVLIIVVGGGAAFFLLNRDQSYEDEDDDLLDGQNQVVEHTSGSSLEEQTESSDDSGITVDEDGTEWWEDETGVWWYRSVSMDDWEIFEQ